MTKPLPDWCPAAEVARHRTRPSCCGLETILEDGKRLRCHEEPGHEGMHICPCGQDRQQK